MPNFFSVEEYADIVFVYGFANRNASEAVREYSRRFPERRLPDRRTFANTFRTPREAGSFPKPPSTARDVQDVGRVEEVSIFFLRISICASKAEAQLCIPYRAVERILAADGRHPYHRPVQELLGRYMEARIRFCEWLTERCTKDRWFTRRILWSDEATFTRDGLFNAHPHLGGG